MFISFLLLDLILLWNGLEFWRTFQKEKKIFPWLGWAIITLYVLIMSDLGYVTGRLFIETFKF